jgi:dTDP-4-amino-4,6-dideoxygalactose transaminase
MIENMNIKIPLSKMEKDLSILPIIQEIIESGIYVNGPHLSNFEKKTAQLYHVKYSVAVNSGTSAIYSVLYALNIKPNDEIIVPSMTFFSSVSPILALGARPIFIEINPKTYCIDEKKLEQLITTKTKAIIPVHLYGQIANMPEIMEIAQKNHLMVIEDACQAHGAEIKGKKAGCFGNAGCFSFYPSKNLTVFGQGGLITTNDKELYENVRSLRDYGQRSKFNHQQIGFNFSISEITAAFGEKQCDKLETLNQIRIQNAFKYASAFKTIADIILPPISNDKSSVYHLFVIRVPNNAKYNRNKLHKFLESRQIQTGIHYPIPVHLQNAYTTLFNDNKKLPITEQLCNEVLSIPMSPFLLNEEIEYVIENITTFFRS